MGCVVPTPTLTLTLSVAKGKGKGRGRDLLNAADHGASSRTRYLIDRLLGNTPSAANYGRSLPLAVLGVGTTHREGGVAYRPSARLPVSPTAPPSAPPAATTP